MYMSQYMLLYSRIYGVWVTHHGDKLSTEDTSYSNMSAVTEVSLSIQYIVISVVGLDGAVEVGLGWWFRGESDLRSVCRFLSVFGRRWVVSSRQRAASRARDTRCSVFGLLVLYLLRWFCLPSCALAVALRCFVCVALRCLAFVLCVPVGMS